MTGKPVSLMELKHLLGDVDDDLILAVADTGASYQDVICALHWLDDDEVTGAGAVPVLSAKARHVCDLLASQWYGRERKETAKIIHK